MFVFEDISEYLVGLRRFCASTQCKLIKVAMKFILLKLIMLLSAISWSLQINNPRYFKDRNMC